MPMLQPKPMLLPQPMMLKPTHEFFVEAELQERVPFHSLEPVDDLEEDLRYDGGGSSRTSSGGASTYSCSPDVLLSRCGLITGAGCSSS